MSDGNLKGKYWLTINDLKIEKDFQLLQWENKAPSLELFNYFF